MICRECKHAKIEKTKEGIAMGKMGYRSCAAAKTPQEMARYFSGGNVCPWSDRAVKSGDASSPKKKSKIIAEKC